MKIIGISSWTEFRESLTFISLNDSFVENFNLPGIIPIILPISEEKDLRKYFSLIDGLVLTGGSDIDPYLYGEEASRKNKGQDIKRDLYDKRILDLAIKKKIPTLCICRGLHLLNSHFNGSLYQDLDEEFNTKLVHDSNINKPILHNIYNKEGSFMYNLYGGETRVNSFHHQGIKKLGDNLDIVSTSEDGLIEAVKVKKEDIYGIQWHPEFIGHNEEFDKIFRFCSDVVKNY